MSQIKLTEEEVKKVQSAHVLYDTLTEIYKNSLDDKETKAKILADLTDAKVAFDKAKDEVVVPKVPAGGNWELNYSTGIVTVD